MLSSRRPVGVIAALMPGAVRDVLRLVTGLLPRGRFKTVVLRLLGWELAPGSSVGICVLWRIDRLVMASGSTIGSFTVCRNLRRMELGKDSVIGQWNWITAAPDLRELAEHGASFILGHHSAITSRHYLDAAGGIRVGAHCTIAGVRSTFLTHQIDTLRCVQSVVPVGIGDYAIVSSNCRLVPGAEVPSHSLVGMGATVLPGLTESYSLYVGAPARAVRKLPEWSEYFRKSDTYIGT